VIIVTNYQVGGFFVLDKSAKKSIISPSDRMVGYWILGQSIFTGAFTVCDNLWVTAFYVVMPQFCSLIPKQGLVP